MIKGLQLRNFKCFQKSPFFAFSKINLFTGINGRGKSTLLQSLLILSQTAQKDPTFSKLIINDELLSLGTYDDIKNSETPRTENIVFDILFDAPIPRITLKYKENEYDLLVADLKRLCMSTVLVHQKVE